MSSWRQRFEQQLVFDSGLVQVGRFRLDGADPGFSQGLAPGHYIAVFPETSVEIEIPGRGSFVTDRTVATLYNPEDVFRRGLHDPRGDYCWWLSAGETVLRGLVPRLSTPSESLLPYPVTSCASSVFVLQRLVCGLCSGAGTLEEKPIEVAVQLVLRKLLQPRINLQAENSQVPRSWLRTASRARHVLLESYRSRLTIEEIGLRAWSSPYHLARIFKRVTGSTLHSYRTALRLRRGIDELLQRRGGINQVAFGLGFASHSHFSGAFRRAFGMSPSGFLRILDGRTRLPLRSGGA